MFWQRETNPRLCCHPRETVLRNQTSHRLTQNKIWYSSQTGRCSTRATKPQLTATGAAKFSWAGIAGEFNCINIQRVFCLPQNTNIESHNVKVLVRNGLLIQSALYILVIVVDACINKIGTIQRRLGRPDKQWFERKKHITNISYSQTTELCSCVSFCNCLDLLAIYRRV